MKDARTLRWCRRLPPLRWAVTALLCLAALPAAAHPLGNYSINQYFLLDARSDQPRLYYLLDMAEIPSFPELDAIDTDFDSVVSPEEEKAYLDARVPELVGKIRLAHDGADVPLEVVDRRLALTEGSAAMVVINILVTMVPAELPLPSPGGTAAIEISSANYQEATGIRECKLLTGGRFVDLTEGHDRQRLGYQTRVFTDPAGNQVYQDFDADFVLTVGRGSGASTGQADEMPAFSWTATARAARDSGDRLMEKAFGEVYADLTETQAQPAPAESSPNAAKPAPTSAPRPVLRHDTARESELPAAADQRYSRPAKGTEGSVGALYDRVSAVIRSERITPAMYAVALLVALVLGAAHARSPGHGKTVMAAYLVGERGTVGHAVLLGLAVTITHTWSVILLGVVTLSLREYVAEDTLSFWMGVASGVLIVAIGVSLFLRRYRAWILARHGHPPHAHAHAHPHDPLHATTTKLAPATSPAPGGRENLQFSIFNSHPHSHGTAAEAQPLDHEHSHDHHGHTHVVTAADGAPPSYWSILGLGVSGGIVPCPTALIVLLLAIRFGRLGFGLALILAFSLGLALVLITIGILVVRATGFVQRFAGPGGGRLRLLSVLSSSAIILLGLWVVVWTLLQYNVLVIRP